MKYLQSKGKQLTDAKDESFERHEKGINRNIQNTVTGLWVRTSSQNVMLLKLTGKKGGECLARKECYLTASHQK